MTKFEKFCLTTFFPVLYPAIVVIAMLVCFTANDGWSKAWKIYWSKPI